jgi:hypothetical protein
VVVDDIATVVVQPAGGIRLKQPLQPLDVVTARMAYTQAGSMVRNTHLGLLLLTVN